MLLTGAGNRSRSRSRLDRLHNTALPLLICLFSVTLLPIFYHSSRILLYMYCACIHLISATGFLVWPACSLSLLRAHSAAVTCTLFAPVPELVFEAVERGREAAGRGRSQEERSGDLVAAAGEGGAGIPLTGYVVISGDYDGDIKVFIKEGKVRYVL